MNNQQQIQQIIEADKDAQKLRKYNHIQRLKRLVSTDNLKKRTCKTVSIKNLLNLYVKNLKLETRSEGKENQKYTK